MTATDCALFLRRVLGLDAIASGATGLLFALGSGALADALKLDQGFTNPIGLFLVCYGAAVAALALQVRPARTLVMVVIGANSLWVLASAAMLIMQWQSPNVFGTAFVIAQTAVVAGFAGLQTYALIRRAAQTSNPSTHA